MWQISVRWWWICCTTSCRNIVVSSSVGGVVQHVRIAGVRVVEFGTNELTTVPRKNVTLLVELWRSAVNVGKRLTTGARTKQTERDVIEYGRVWWCGAGVWSNDGDCRCSDVCRWRQLHVLLEATWRNANGRTAGGVRQTSGGLRDRWRFRLTGQLPRLLRSLWGQCLLSLRRKSQTYHVDYHFWLF